MLLRLVHRHATAEDTGKLGDYLDASQIALFEGMVADRLSSVYGY